jgi:opacity protein-like surface antigen
MSAIRSSFVIGGLAFASLTSVARAQDMGNGFFFGTPTGSFVVRGGWAMARAGSDLFSFTTDQLTLNRGDFSSPSGDIDLAFNVTPQWQIVASGSVAITNRRSEFRHFEDNNNLPIEQTTTFERIPLTANVKVHLAPTGRSIGHLAWIPSRIVPYVGGGVGMMSYRFRQQGDFVDFNTNNVFNSTVDTQEDGRDWAFVQQVMAGVDYNFSPMFGVTLDARYLHGRGDLGNAFTGYDKIDLSGASASAGISVRL